MRVVLDTNVLLQVIGNVKPGSVLHDPRDSRPIERAIDRAEALVEKIDSAKGSVLIPAPVLAEVLIGLTPIQSAELIENIRQLSCFEMVSFDELAAIECAGMITPQELKAALADPSVTKAKFRFDRQILAIALANNVNEIWTHDKQLFEKAASLGITVRSLGDIEPNPEQLEADLQY